MYLCKQNNNLLFLLSVSKRHYLYAMFWLGAISITPTLLRLIPPLGGSDGRCVHVLDLFSWRYFTLHYCQVHLFAELLLLIWYLFIDCNPFPPLSGLYYDLTYICLSIIAYFIFLRYADDGSTQTGFSISGSDFVDYRIKEQVPLVW